MTAAYSIALYSPNLPLGENKMNETKPDAPARGFAEIRIERLRADAESTDDIGLCADAADRIEQLESDRHLLGSK